MRLSLLFALLSSTAFGQFTLQQSNSTAIFRGVHAVSEKVAWVSGTRGTVLHTIDGGEHWLPCITPTDAEKLDFRGIQAFDEKTAIVMSSGTGVSSRLYKTVDGCKTWTLIFRNPDANGFWDAITFSTPQRGWLLGDPVDGNFSLFATFDAGATWDRVRQAGLAASTGVSGAFAASNSIILPHLPLDFAVQDGWFYQGNSNCTMSINRERPKACLDLFDFEKQKLPIASGADGAGIYSLAEAGKVLVAVGGDYTKPEKSELTAAYSLDRGLHWQSALNMPHGYRSAVAQAMNGKYFVAVGTNGTDVSYDNGKTWKPVGTNPEESNNWNALSLPFVVGSKGRIGKLNPTEFKKK